MILLRWGLLLYLFIRAGWKYKKKKISCKDQVGLNGGHKNTVFHHYICCYWSRHMNLWSINIPCSSVAPECCRWVCFGWVAGVTYANLFSCQTEIELMLRFTCNTVYSTWLVGIIFQWLIFPLLHCNKFNKRWQKLQWMMQVRKTIFEDPIVKT